MIKLITITGCMGRMGQATNKSIKKKKNLKYKV